jgi:hypothetical protein
MTNRKKPGEAFWATVVVVVVPVAYPLSFGLACGVAPARQSRAGCAGRSELIAPLVRVFGIYLLIRSP